MIYTIVYTRLIKRKIPPADRAQHCVSVDIVQNHQGGTMRRRHPQANRRFQAASHHHSETRRPPRVSPRVRRLALPHQPTGGMPDFFQERERERRGRMVKETGSWLIRTPPRSMLLNPMGNERGWPSRGAVGRRHRF